MFEDIIAEMIKDDARQLETVIIGCIPERDHHLPLADHLCSHVITDRPGWVRFFWRNRPMIDIGPVKLEKTDDNQFRTTREFERWDWSNTCIPQGAGS